MFSYKHDIRTTISNFVGSDTLCHIIFSCCRSSSSWPFIPLLTMVVITTGIALVGHLKKHCVPWIAKQTPRRYETTFVFIVASFAQIAGNITSSVIGVIDRSFQWTAEFGNVRCWSNCSLIVLPVGKADPDAFTIFTLDRK